MKTYHIKWPNGGIEHRASECETLEGLVNEVWGEPSLYAKFLADGGAVQTEEEVRDEFAEFQRKLVAQDVKVVAPPPGDAQDVTKVVAPPPGDQLSNDLNKVLENN